MPHVKVEVATEATDELAKAFARLVPQLSSSSPPPTKEELGEMVAAPSTTVLVARDNTAAESSKEPIVGALTLVMFRIPTGIRAWIEDVVVDKTARRKGVGEALTLEAVRRARLGGAKTVELTSRPSRQDANRLYQKLGFAQRETNVYRNDCG